MRFVVGILVVLVSACAQLSEAQPASVAGKWTVTASFANGASSAEMTLNEAAGVIEGASGPLDENRYFPLNLKGAMAHVRMWWRGLRNQGWRS